MTWHLLGFKLLNTLSEFLCSKQLTGISLVVENYQNYHDPEDKFSFKLTVWKNWKATISDHIWKLCFVKWSHRKKVLCIQITFPTAFILNRCQICCLHGSLRCFNSTFYWPIFIQILTHLIGFKGHPQGKLWRIVKVEKFSDNFFC